MRSIAGPVGSLRVVGTRAGVGMLHSGHGMRDKGSSGCHGRGRDHERDHFMPCDSGRYTSHCYSFSPGSRGSYKFRYSSNKGRVLGARVSEL